MVMEPAGPTLIGLPGLLVAVLIGVTVAGRELAALSGVVPQSACTMQPVGPEPVLATYTVLPFGVIATVSGHCPTLTGLPALPVAY